MKDWQPTPGLGVTPVRGWLFCYLRSRVLTVKRFSCSRSGCRIIWQTSVEFGISFLYSTGTCHMAQL